MVSKIYAFLLLLVISVSFSIGYHLPKNNLISEGDLWIAEKIDNGYFWKIRGSWCGCCGSDFWGWLYAPKSFNFTVSS